jgi:hypothetical protein
MDQDKEEQSQKQNGPEVQEKEVSSPQNRNEGEKEEVNTESYADVEKLGQLLKNLNFPAPKSKILHYIRQTEYFHNKDSILRALNGLEKKSYYSFTDIATTAGLVNK